MKKLRIARASKNTHAMATPANIIAVLPSPDNVSVLLASIMGKAAESMLLAKEMLVAQKMCCGTRRALVVILTTLHVLVVSAFIL